MAAFVAWLVGSITGSRGTDEPSEENKQAVDTSKVKLRTEAKQNKGKVRQRAKKANEEPTFNTKLSTPIEDIIEETLSEEKTETQSSSSQATSEVSATEKPISKKKKKPVKKEKSQKKSDEEGDIGPSFSKPHPNQRESKKSLELHVETKVYDATSPLDDHVGFSFFPVKKRIQKGKGKSEGKPLLEKQNSDDALTAVIAQGIAKRSDLSRPSIIDHYKNQNVPLKKRDFTPHIKENTQSFVFVDKVDSNITKADFKESKKVSSHISYASIVTNSVPDNLNSEEEAFQKVSINDIAEEQEKLSKEASSSIEVLSQCSEDPDSTELAQEVSETTVITENSPFKQQSTFPEGSKESQQLEQSSYQSVSVLEGDAELIHKSIGEDQKNQVFSLYFEENILDSGINTVKNSEHSHSQSYIQNHLEYRHSEEIESINKDQAVNEKYINSQDLAEAVENDTEGFDDQVISDIIEQIVQNEEKIITEDSKAQDDINNLKTLLNKESKDYLEETFNSQQKDHRENFKEVSANSLENNEDLQAYAGIDHKQYSQEFLAQEIILSNSTDQTQGNTKISESSYQDKFAISERPTVEEHLQEYKLSSSDEQFISDIVEDYIRSEIQQEVSPESLEIRQEVQEIVAVEQFCPKQDSQQKPVEEPLFIKKGDNETKDNAGSIVAKDLNRQDTENSFNVDEIKLSATNTEENQIPNTKLVNTLEQNQTKIKNQKLSADLVDSTQVLESLVIEETKDFGHIVEDSLVGKNHIEEITVQSQIIENNAEDLASIIEEQSVDKQSTNKKIQKNLKTTIESTQVDILNQEISPESDHKHIREKTDTEYSHPIEESLIENMAQVRVLTINDREHQESTIYRIEKNFVLQFRLGPSLLGRKIKLYCNYPRETNGILNGFERDTYQLLSWCQDEGCKNADDTALFTQIIAKISGSFHYYFIYENSDTEDRQGSGYFLVDPILKYGNDEELPLDCIQCQTVLAKQLGSFSSWENKLKVAKESGYNVIHFTPIQELGISKSSYSLSEQLKLNPMFQEENGKRPTFEDVEKLTAKMRTEWKVLSVCDIVLNHTANESEWLKEHPEATYNCVNCPYMRPAYLLDAAFHLFSMDVKKGYYEDRGIPSEVSTEEHLNAIRYHIKTSVVEPLKLQELFTVDVNKHLENFLTLARKTPPIGENERKSLGELSVTQDPEFRRLESKIDIDLALKIFNVYRLDCFDEESRVKRCAEDLKNKLDSLNEAIIKEVTDDLNAAIENILAGIRYFRVQADGPKFKDITLNHPLVDRYFTDYGSPKSLKEHEEIMYSENGHFLMAHNGWVMNSDPLKNFAANAWGDSVKLRYGDRPEDSPFLWDYMRKYVEQTAKIFDGLRLDNCHSTPIPVAEYLLDAARKVRPDLYVVAELFTNSDLTDNIFVNRLGITSLIREAMSAWDSHEEGRLVYRYGGVPVGSFFQPSVRPLVPMVAHALFLDLTHDNPSPVEKRSVFDLLPSTALVNMACCASGSTRGYDELVPHHIHVVDETRQYPEWSDDESLVAGNVRFVNDRFGIIAAKKALNELHFKLGKDGYKQVYVDQMDPDIVAVTRHNPETHTSFVLVAFTAFGHPDIHADSYQRGIKPLRVEGVLDEIVLEASLSHIEAKSGGSRFTKFEAFSKDSTWINGLSEYQVSLKQHIQVNQSNIFEEVNSGTDNVFQLNFKHFKPGSIAVVRVSLPENVNDSVTKVRGLISSFSAKKDSDLKQIISRMSLSDLNRALYRCDQEERDEGNGFDVYNIPNFGPMVYCGLQGFMSLLANIRPNNDLGHPFCANLRDGNWLIEYIWKRLKVDEGTKELGQWIEENTKYLQRIPRYLIPSYFDVIVTGIYINLLEQSYSLMSNFVKSGSTFVRSLSLGSLQFGGYVRSADLPALSPNLAPPKPPTRKNKNEETVQACVTLSAGLPHFAIGYMRNWGRDTFIALRGLFILTGRFEEARQHILGYAACLRHGLIPNLLDGGRNPRYNCRDAIWWWLYCLKSYCEEAPNGIAILSDKVSRIFPTDASTPQPPGAVDQLLHDIIQEGLKVHFQGLKFRERNAGRQIDEHMNDAGFNNQIGIHPETGFVFGGNQWNCGTWMDKMGSSDNAGNRGKPATPRDGSAVELVGLSKAAVLWLWKLNQEGKYPYDGVERTHKNGATTKWTFKEWSDKIQANFEKKFWVGLKPSSEESRPDLINKKSIYKDLCEASQPWTEYQLRCNFPIAMVAAPEMFDPQHAWAALEQAEKYLLGPLGMKTLDAEDWNYRGDYDNSNDSHDFNTAHGFNYHQGPEWVWPVGFFLRAKLIFAAQNGMLKETLASTKVILSKHFTELQTSPWRGLPELTNNNGSYCRDSSRTQAWSMSCILEVLYDLQQIESKQIIVN